jgi:hypothetical protein
MTETNVTMTEVYSHRVRGQGEHEHHRYATPTGEVVEVTRWPRHPGRNSWVRRLDRGGVMVTEERHSGLISVRGLLRMSGYDLEVDGPVT